MNAKPKIVNPTEKSPVGTIIRGLMRECGNIKESELARQTGLPQATINRLLLGGTSDPRASTLASIAKFFNVSVGQLIGAEPIDQLRMHGSHVASKDAAKAVPLIQWEDAIHWNELKNQINPVNHADWVIMETEADKDCFALKSTPAFEPTFPSGSILIFGSENNDVDGAYVLVEINQSTTLKKLVVSDKIYLEHPFNKSIPPIPLDEKYKIIGHLIETRIYF